MRLGAELVAGGVLAVVVAVAWLWGAWALGAVGLVAVVLGLVVDWDRWL